MITMPFATYTKTLNKSSEVNDNFEALADFFDGNITADAFASDLNGTLTFTGPAITITSTGTLSAPLVDVSSSATDEDAFVIAATNAFSLSSDLTGPWVRIVGNWDATGGTLTAGQVLVTGINAAVKFGAYATGDLPTPSGAAITYNTTESRLEAYDGADWAAAADSWVEAPITIDGDGFAVGSTSIGSYSRGRGVGTGATTATATAFEKERATSPLVVFATADIQKTSGVAEGAGYTVTLTLKRGATTVDTATFTYLNETSGKSNGGSVSWDTVVTGEPAGTNDYSVTIAHTSTATVVTAVSIAVVEL
jgi:hypothetical protein